MISKQDIVHRIYEDWGSSTQADICVSILNYILSLNASTSHITYGNIRKSSEIVRCCSDDDLQEAISYLCGERVNLLDIGFELIENGEYIEISTIELAEARKEGSLLHPSTGELIENFEQQVYVYFKPSMLSRKLVL